MPQNSVLDEEGLDNLEMSSKPEISRLEFFAQREAYVCVLDDKPANVCRGEANTPPTSASIMVKVEDHKRSEHVTFHRMGLTGDDIGAIHPPSIGGLKHKVNQTWELRKLTTIKKMLGHENRKIDVLKLDIESYEWEALKNFYQEKVLEDVTQFIMEWHVFLKHPKVSELPKIYRLYEHLEEIGFRSFHKEYDTVDNKADLSAFHTQSDTCWVNTKKAIKQVT